MNGKENRAAALAEARLTNCKMLIANCLQITVFS